MPRPFPSPQLILFAVAAVTVAAAGRERTTQARQ